MGRKYYYICQYLRKTLRVAASLIPGDKFAVRWNSKTRVLSVCDSELKKEYYKYKLVLNDMYHWMENFFIASPKKTIITKKLIKSILLRALHAKGKHIGGGFYYLLRTYSNVIRIYSYSEKYIQVNCGNLPGKEVLLKWNEKKQQIDLYDMKRTKAYKSYKITP